MKYWNIPVTPHLDKVVVKAVELNVHVSKADFVRSAVREKLITIGLKKELDTIEKGSVSS